MTSVVSLKPAQALESTPAQAAQAALEALEQAYAYYTPEPRQQATAHEPQTELFDYYCAA